MLGVYTAASGMIAQSKKEDLLANNLANLNTPGFKAGGATQQAFSSILMERLGRNPTPIGAVGTGAILGQTHVDFSQGALQHTGQPLDFALEGTGFFAVQAPGGTEYTRAGDFTLNGNGGLVTQAGYPVLSVGGTPLVLGSGTVTVAGDGTISVNGSVVGQLQVDNFANVGALVMGADGYFKAGTNAGSPASATASATASVTGTKVLQGNLEVSNTNQLKETVDMLTVFRAYEADQKAILSQAQTLAWAAGQVGKV